MKSIHLGDRCLSFTPTSGFLKVSKFSHNFFFFPHKEGETRYKKQQQNDNIIPVENQSIVWQNFQKTSPTPTVAQITPQNLTN